MDCWGFFVSYKCVLERNRKRCSQVFLNRLFGISRWLEVGLFLRRIGFVDGVGLEFVLGRRLVLVCTRDLRLILMLLILDPQVWLGLIG